MRKVSVAFSLEGFNVLARLARFCQNREIVCYYIIYTSIRSGF